MPPEHSLLDVSNKTEDEGSFVSSSSSSGATDITFFRTRQRKGAPTPFTVSSEHSKTAPANDIESNDINSQGEDVTHDDSLRQRFQEEQPVLRSPENTTKRRVGFSQRRTSLLIYGTAGIYMSYLYYGHVQEDLFRYRSPSGEAFRSVWLLQSMESIANISMGLAGRRLFGGRSGLQLQPFFATGVAQVFAKALTSLALAAGLSFPVCILVKSAKIVPVMLGQLALGGSRYGTRDYAFAVLIVCGTALLSAGSKQTQNGQAASSAAGVVCITVSLFMDGVTAGLQKRLLVRTKSAPPTTYDFLLFTNLAMAVVAVSISFGMTLDGLVGLAFMQDNPDVARMVLTACLCSAVGQSFIFFVVATFDPLVCSTITTTRKILSVLWSIVTKGHELSGQGSVGLALAMSGLILEVQGKATKAPPKGLSGEVVAATTPPREELSLTNTETVTTTLATMSV